MNLRLERAVVRRDTSHKNVTDVSFFVREDFTRHDLRLNSPGKKRLMQLVAERVVHGRASIVSSIPVITRARASHLLA
jgi:hypothetical protein